MPLTKDQRERLQRAEEKHKRGDHEGAIEIIKDMIKNSIQQAATLEKADAYCLYGYCLEDRENYLQAKKRHLFALCLIRNVATVEIEDKIKVEIEREERVEDRLKQENRGMNEDERKLEEEWRVREKGIATNLFNEFDKLMPVTENAQMDAKVFAAKVFSALGDLFEKERDVDARMQYERAKKLCACVINEGGANNIKAKAHYRMGYALMKLEDYTGSEKSYEAAIKYYAGIQQISSDDRKIFAKAYNGLGNLYLTLDRLEKAKETYEGAIKADKSFTPAINNLAYTLYLLEDYKGAERWCIKARDSGEESAEFFDTLGCVYSGLERYEESRKAFEMALTKKKLDPFIYNSYGEMLRIIGSYEKAEELFKEAIKLDNSWAIGHSNLGDLYRERKEYEEAKKEYKKAKDSDPCLPDARLGLAEIYALQAGKAEEFNKALEEIEYIPKVSPEWVGNRPRFYFVRGYIYRGLEDDEKARIDFERCKRLAKKRKENEKIFLRAKDYLSGIERIEPDEKMRLGGIGLAILAGIVLTVLTGFYLCFQFKELPSSSKKDPKAESSVRKETDKETTKETEKEGPKNSVYRKRL